MKKENVLKKWPRRLLIGLGSIVPIGALAVGYLLLWQGRPPARRPDLVRLPENAPPAPRGYPTMNSIYAAYVLKRLDLLDPAFDWPVPPGVAERKDVEYGRVGDRPLLLDLYYPEALDHPLPGLLFIHGGGWVGGDKRDYKYYTVRYAQRGYVVATMGYRFADEAGFPACVEDAKCAVRWMRSQAEELRVDPDRIAVIGGSAGGYLAMMVGYSPEREEWNASGGHEGVSSSVAAVVDLYGPPDLTVPMAQTHPTVTGFLKTPYDQDPQLYASASPITHLDENDPPTLVIQGTLDDIVPVEFTDALVEKMQELNLPHCYARIDGWPHTMDAARPVNEYVQWLMNAFLEEHLARSHT